MSSIEFTKFKEINDFIKKSTKEVIKEKLYFIIQDKNYCYEKIGNGYFGKVGSYKIGNHCNLMINNKKITLPIVSKTTNDTQNTITNYLEIVNDILYISGNNNLTNEMLILSYVNELWLHCINLPFLLLYTTCDNTNMVNELFIERVGLTKKAKYNNEPNINYEIFHGFETELESYLTNIYELFRYILVNRIDENITLPNNITCNIIELFDCICISYLATYHLLTENNIFPFDMHESNLFVKWLNDYKYINNATIKHITYKINNEYYKIKTFGLIITLGDLGMSVAKIKDDVMLIGQMNKFNNEKITKINLDVRKENYKCLIYLSIMIPPSLLKKTILYIILNEPPFDEISAYTTSYTYGLYTLDMLKYYEKYKVNEYSSDDDNLLINVKKYL